jgi:hypothetical protein
LRGLARDDATAFRQYESKLTSTHVIGATAEKNRLSATTRALIRAFETLAAARTAQQYNDLQDSTHVATLLDDWQAQAIALDDKLTGR